MALDLTSLSMFWGKFSHMGLKTFMITPYNFQQIEDVKILKTQMYSANNIQYVALSNANNNGKNTLENLSILIADLRAFCAGVREGGFFNLAESKKELSLAGSKTGSILGTGCAGFGPPPPLSPSTMFTRQYSMRAMKTKLEKC